jgi:hypothetical protein
MSHERFAMNMGNVDYFEASQFASKRQKTGSSMNAQSGSAFASERASGDDQCIHNSMDSNTIIREGDINQQ